MTQSIRVCSLCNRVLPLRMAVEPSGSHTNPVELRILRVPLFLYLPHLAGKEYKVERLPSEYYNELEVLHSTLLITGPPCSGPGSGLNPLSRMSLPILDFSQLVLLASIWVGLTLLLVPPNDYSSLVLAGSPELPFS